jgi:double-strand break repair protein MRE11
MNFHVIQPGSSVATSLCAGEAVPKHCGILSITGRDFHLEKIRLKTVRPFVYKEIILAEQKEMKNVWRKPNNRTTITQFLSEMVEELIEEAKEEWLSLQEESSQEVEIPLPLVRLRVEYSSPEGNFEMENPQRFSSRFVGKVANSHDVVQFHRKKTTYKRIKTDDMEIDEEKLLAKMDNDIQNITFKDLVGEFLEKATLEIIPVNGLSDAVGQFVNKDDKHATETFVDEARKACLTKMKEFDELDEGKITDIVNAHKSYLEDQFSKGQLKIKKVCCVSLSSFFGLLTWRRETRNLSQNQTSGTRISMEIGPMNPPHKLAPMTSPQTMKRTAHLQEILHPHVVVAVGEVGGHARRPLHGNPLPRRKLQPRRHQRKARKRL